MKPQDKLFMAVGGTVVAVAAGVTGVYLFAKSDAPLPSTNATATSSLVDNSSTISSNTSTTSGSAANSDSFKDGTYSATGSYGVPRGYTNDVTAKVTIVGGKVTDVTVTHDYTDRESGMYIDSFNSAIESVVVGQSIDGLSASRVGGATLTTDGFNVALENIISQAKA